MCTVKYHRYQYLLAHRVASQVKQNRCFVKLVREDERETNRLATLRQAVLTDVAALRRRSIYRHISSIDSHDFQGGRIARYITENIPHDR
uniref:Uncharacterized protein n=1 Tax=Candidatus Kentrum sp. LFY TaxID=2126342 RepID=A0A450WN42_9GAMM|nr:MAG: hypothetical protein BECKLFY1418A_GA0070994_104915 [Candidatus Kentron sp. LFY]VFK18414.1 MAG: hypothetical protein BECKLFY1418C_GA0070996_104316 [Candidatus Kentron sp. LFY]